MSVRFPVARPRLPDADAILPYLRRIDDNRYYSNFGPLVGEVEARLAKHFDVSPACVTTVANATSGLTAALQAEARTRRRNVNDGPAFCLLPAWTFVATLHAVLAAGLEPYLLDVDEESWALTPEAVENALGRIPGQPVAVMPVAPFGRPLDMAAWDALSERTGLAVVVDAAAGFDRSEAANSPAVFSLHATKVLAAGEGGFAVSRDAEQIDAIRKCINFGFMGDRVARSRAINGKMSEYHAAVTLAALDAWPETRRVFDGIARAYQDAFAGQTRIRVMPGETDEYATSTMLLVCDEPLPEEAIRAVEQKGVETRRWWGGGVAKQVAYRRFSSDLLPVTDWLAARCVGLPCYPGLSREDVAEIAAVVGDTLLDR
ncbi:MAG: DegT/DnrJ/EryC1/StrS family aminotransferase [Alphaproteobacteria bacterium]|nr:DegT/DnrJ/EryC1/StrS family aminotransferase [Alphaproteobacteria bacterium]